MAGRKKVKQGKKTKFNLGRHLASQLNFYLSALATLILSAGIWFYFQNQVTRFTFIMPVIATWIFYLIMTEIKDD